MKRIDYIMTIIINVKSPQKGQLKKFANLVNDREKALNVKVLRANLSNYKGVILAYRASDNSYIVWNTYFHGENDRCSYDGFSNGDYDMSLQQAINEFKNRLA